MLEWVAVAIAGAIGGFVSIFLRAGSEVPSPPVIDAVLEDHPTWRFLYHLLRNTVFGGVASLLLWALYSSNADFTSTKIVAHQLATACVVGGGGVSVVDTLFRQAHQQRAIQNAADAILDLQAAVEEEAEDGEGESGSTG